VRMVLLIIASQCRASMSIASLLNPHPRRLNFVGLITDRGADSAGQHRPKPHLGIGQVEIPPWRLAPRKHTGIAIAHVSTPAKI
jgi:hypothetical protein